MASDRRAYESSHPWLTFALDTRAFSPQLWILLGEAASKVEHIAGVPLKPAIAEELHKLYLAKGVLATTAIEGNTLSEEEVRQRLDGKLRLPESREYLGREVDNVAAACSGIWKRMDGSGVEPLSIELIERYNAQVLSGLALDEGVEPGVIRKHSVVVGRYRGAPPEDCRFLLGKLCEWLEHPSFSGAGASPELRVPIAILQAILAHLYLAWIHPFGDGNGRTARLVEFQLLLRASFPTLAAHLLSNHYNQTRSDYYRCLDQASRNKEGVASFIEYATQGLVDGLREQVERVKQQQFSLAWRDYVHETLAGTGSTTARQRALVFALTGSDPVAPKRIPDLSPALARFYAAKTTKTLTRDLHALEKVGLVERIGPGYAACVEVIAAFLPWRNRVGTARRTGKPPGAHGGARSPDGTR